MVLLKARQRVRMAVELSNESSAIANCQSVVQPCCGRAGTQHKLAYLRVCAVSVADRFLHLHFLHVEFQTAPLLLLRRAAKLTVLARETHRGGKFYGVAAGKKIRDEFCGARRDLNCGLCLCG